MKIYIEQISNDGDNRRLSLKPGQTLHVGNDASADIVVRDDRKMSGEHFAIEHSRDACRLRNLRSKGVTTVNGKQVKAEIELHDGDAIVAGTTSFRVTVVDPPVNSNQDSADPALVIAESDLTEAHSPDDSLPKADVHEPDLAVPEAAESVESGLAEGDPADSAAVEPDPVERELDIPLDENKAPILKHLRQLKLPLFAILDAARDPMVLALLVNGDLEYQSLYEGEKGDKLAAVAPYLISLPADSQFLKKLIELGWGESWGVYLTCDKPLKEVRKQLRRFLMVKKEDSKKEVYFRYYDPRVLRVFLPTCLPKEAEQFFGPMDSFFVEDEDSIRLLEFSANLNGKPKVIESLSSPTVSLA